jgi:hypothetical protein
VCVSVCVYMCECVCVSVCVCVCECVCVCVLRSKENACFQCRLITLFNAVCSENLMASIGFIFRLNEILCVAIDNQVRTGNKTFVMLVT